MCMSSGMQTTMMSFRGLRFQSSCLMAFLAYSRSLLKQSTHLEAGPLDVDNHVGRARPVVRQPLGDAAQLLNIACIGPCASSCFSISSGHRCEAS